MSPPAVAIRRLAPRSAQALHANRTAPASCFSCATHLRSASQQPQRQAQPQLPTASASQPRRLSAFRTTAPSPSVPAARRGYRSYDHPNVPPTQDAFSAAEQAILTKAYEHIPEHGFTEHTILLGAQDAGYPSISTTILPDGVFSLVRWHLVNQRNALAARGEELFGPLAHGSPENPAEPIREEVLAKAERLTWERLLGNRQVVGRWQEALAVMAQPSYVPASLRELALLSDEIWALAGDTSVDPTWYTKRAALSAIYASSELFMTTDNDPEFAATREFLRRRFDGSQELGGYVRSVGQWVGFAASAGVNVLRSKGVPI